MKRWILISLSTLLFPLAHACELKKEVVSLSGTATVLFDRLGLLQKLKGISLFNPVTGYKGIVYPGGIFLPQSTVEKFSGSAVFFDESQELRKTLKREKGIEAIEIKNRGLYPADAVKEALFLIRPFVKNCEQKIAAIELEAIRLQREAGEKFSKKVAVFYLGALKQRWPELVIVNDGMVKYLIEQRKLKSYPSPLGYINWSAKTMKELPSSTIHIGLQNSSHDSTPKIERSPKGVTISYPGILVPGMTQLEGFLFLAQSL